MRFIINIFIVAALAFFVGLYFPWWTIVVIAFLASLLLPQKPAVSFLSGFMGIFLLWVILAAFINASNAGILAGKIGALLKMGNSPSILIFVTGFIGGLVAGFASLSASYLRYHKSS